MHHSEIKADVRKLIADGTVLPAHPLALDANRALDIRHQRALTRYYLDAGAGGLAVGVHTTQFAIRDVGLYRPVLELAAETAASWTQRPVAMVAGLAGPTPQATAEAQTARGIGYHAGLLSLVAMKLASEDEIIAHCGRWRRHLPLIGFYLQPAVGGGCSARFLAPVRFTSGTSLPSRSRRSIATERSTCFARWQESGRDHVALYTGNDDNILLRSDAAVRLARQGRHHPSLVQGRPARALVGVDRERNQAVQMCKAARGKDSLPADLLALDARVTDATARSSMSPTIFTAASRGHEVLPRQGLMQGRWCLDPLRTFAGTGRRSTASSASMPHLTDDAFVKENLQKWLA